MLHRSYVILDNGQPVYDYNVDLIQLDSLHEPPATGDLATVQRLYDTLRELQESGEPVQNYVADAKSWLEERMIADAPEVEEGEDG